MKNVLVTGGLGFIGTNFMHHMVLKYPTTNFWSFDKRTYAGNPTNLRVLTRLRNCMDLQGDICDLDQLSRLVRQEEIDTIIHFAAESHVDNSIEGPREFLDTNIFGTFNILEAMRQMKGKNIRLHHISTDEVFGDLPINEGYFREETAYDPSSPYSATKAASDHLVRSWARTFELPVTISNCSNNYGPYQFPEKIIPVFISKLLNDEPVPLYGSGENVRDWIHVYDHVRAIDTILQKGTVGDTYCVGGDCELSNKELTAAILKATGKVTGRDFPWDDYVEHVPDRAGHDLRYAIDSSKIKEELGWRPIVDFEDGLNRTVRWYVENRQWIDEMLARKQ